MTYFTQLLCGLSFALVLALGACSPAGTAACRARMDARAGCASGDDTPKGASDERYDACRTATVGDEVHACIESWYRTEPCAECADEWTADLECQGQVKSYTWPLCDCGDRDAWDMGLDCGDDDDSAR